MSLSISSADVRKMTVGELKSELSSRGASVAGLKPTLTQRLIELVEANEKNESKVNASDETEGFLVDKNRDQLLESVPELTCGILYITPILCHNAHFFSKMKS